MENFESSIAELLEEESVVLSDELQSFEAWDSLTVLSIIAFCDWENEVSWCRTNLDNSDTILGLRELIESKM